jgi:hypothetical protein
MWRSYAALLMGELISSINGLPLCGKIKHQFSRITVDIFKFMWLPCQMWLKIVSSRLPVFR